MFINKDTLEHTIVGLFDTFIGKCKVNHVSYFLSGEMTKDEVCFDNI